MFQVADHWKDLENDPKAMTEWRDRWPNFMPHEVACHIDPNTVPDATQRAAMGDGRVYSDENALDMLQRFRTAWGRPLTINSGYRTPQWNRMIEGAATASQHVQGCAFDISLNDGRYDGDTMEKLARRLGFTGIGRYRSWIHLDTRPSPTGHVAYWANRGK